MASRVFFPGAPSKIDEQAISNVILLLINVSKQKLLFSPMIFFCSQLSAFCHGLYDSLHM